MHDILCAMNVFFGFIVGFIVGMAVNAYLLRGVPRATFLKNKDMRLRYGALNWAIAVFGAIIAAAVTQ